jgi:hypothetical protein
MQGRSSNTSQFQHFLGDGTTHRDFGIDLISGITVENCEPKPLAFRQRMADRAREARPTFRSPTAGKHRLTTAPPIRSPG